MRAMARLGSCGLQSKARERESVETEQVGTGRNWYSTQRGVDFFQEIFLLESDKV